MVCLFLSFFFRLLILNFRFRFGGAVATGGVVAVDAEVRVVADPDAGSGDVIAGCSIADGPATGTEGEVIVSVLPCCCCCCCSGCWV